MYSCHGEGGNQIFAFAKNRMIVTGNSLCVGVNANTHSVISVKCTDPDPQLWKYDNEVHWGGGTNLLLILFLDSVDSMVGAYFEWTLYAGR